MPKKAPPTVALVSLGCPKNLVDSERMLAGLALGGFVVTPDPDGADVAVVNTCAFIDLARAESDRHLDGLEALKRSGRLGRIVVAGCMAQRFGRQVLARHPLVDAVVGLAARDSLAGVCRRVVDRPQAAPIKGSRPQIAQMKGGRSSGRGTAADGATETIVLVGPHAAAPPDDRERLRLTPRHYAYLRISEGCDNRCAYCAIPDIRGPLRSKPPEHVLAEAAELAADGARELILIGQDTTAYGRDFAPRPGAVAVQSAIRSPQSAIESPWNLARLLKELRHRAAVKWLRLMYTHPASFTDGVIAELAAGLPLAPYVDLPLQHISDPILSSMGRRVTREQVERLIARLRAAAPGAAIRTSFIAGYPGETEAHVRELLDFLQEVRFDHVGVFVYSAEPGTPAARMPGQVPAAQARERWERLMQAAERLALAAARARKGERLEVLVDGADQAGRLLARHAGQAPEVDGAVLLAPGAARPGDFAAVRITGAEGYDLLGEVLPP
ncbi:MAG: 30S ribosomal protein S12 methylthiotransferase RimO [Planctomycetes bacterium]|nr:30S ribosomal protein S12 methylthiotransferase RimO [Planctomycetota bacterium]